MQFFALASALTLWVPDTSGQALSTDPGNSATSPFNRTADALAGSLRTYLLHSMPEPLYEKSTNWGHTARTFRGVKKHGSWRKTRVSALSPSQTLAVEIRDVQTPEPGRMTFTLCIAIDVRAEHWRQRWAAGLKVRDTSVRARFRTRLTLNVEAKFHVEAGGLLLPEVVLGLRVVQSHIQFDNLVVEHIAGVGGEAAELIGETVHKGLRQWRPSVERNLLARAEAAIMEAGRAKEVRLSLRDLVRKRGQGKPTDETSLLRSAH